jgi:hypothetical protein
MLQQYLKKNPFAARPQRTQNGYVAKPSMRGEQREKKAYEADKKVNQPQHTLLKIQAGLQGPHRINQLIVT